MRPVHLKTQQCSTSDLLCAVNIFMLSYQQPFCHLKKNSYSSGCKSPFHVSAIDNMTAKDFLPTSVVHYKTQAELKTIDSYPMMCDFKIMFQNIFFSLS